MNRLATLKCAVESNLAMGVCHPPPPLRLFFKFSRDPFGDEHLLKGEILATDC
jgi:hypothetical protein